MIKEGLDILIKPISETDKPGVKNIQKKCSSNAQDVEGGFVAGASEVVEDMCKLVLENV